MMDTIGVQYPFAISKEFLTSDWGFEREPRKSGFIARWKLEVPMENGCVVTYIYQPHAIKVGPLLRVEFSAPHLVFGDNLFMVLDLEAVINQANIMLPHVPGIPMLDLWEGHVYRLDIPYNFQVGKLVPFYIQAVQPLEFSRRKPRPYSNQGFQWVNNQSALKIYNKELWYIDLKRPLNPDAKGVIRFELTLRKNKVKQLTGKKYPTLHDITIELTMNALENELSGLGLLNRSIGTYNTTLAKLCELYGEYAGFYYFGVLAAKFEYPNRDTIVAASGIHPRALDRRLKKVLDAGLPLTLTKGDEPLPPLTIDREVVMDMVKHGATVMKYQVIPQAPNEPLVSNSLVTPDEIRLLNGVIK